MARKIPNRSKKKKSKRQRPKKSASKVRRRLVADTYESWLSKQSGKVRTGVSSQVSSAVPSNTFQEWMKKQSVRESSETKETGHISSTFDDWMASQVLAKQSQLEESPKTQIQVVEETEAAIMIQPPSKLANPEKTED